jgi:hypothetical protein
MNDNVEIVIKPNIQFIKIKEIPRLIANALHPEPESSERILVDLYLKSKPDKEKLMLDGLNIDDNQWETLNKIWSDAKLPPLPESVTQEQFKPYLKAFNSNSNELEWGIDPLWINPMSDTNIMRAFTTEEHTKAITAAINSGQLQSINRSTRLPIRRFFPDSIVSFKDLKNYLTQFHIELVYETDSKIDEIELNQKLISKADEPFKKLENLKPNEIKLEFVAGNNDSLIMQITARDVCRRYALAELGLIDRRTGDMNEQAQILLGYFAQKRKALISNEVTPQKITRIRNIFKIYLGLKDNPFEMYSSVHGYSPLFEIFDLRGSADERAKKEGFRKSISIENLQVSNVSFEEESDEAGEWLKKHE